MCVNILSFCFPNSHHWIYCTNGKRLFKMNIYRLLLHTITPPQVTLLEADAWYHPLPLPEDTWCEVWHNWVKRASPPLHPLPTCLNYTKHYIIKQQIISTFHLTPRNILKSSSVTMCMVHNKANPKDHCSDWQLGVAQMERTSTPLTCSPASAISLQTLLDHQHYPCSYYQNGGLVCKASKFSTCAKNSITVCGSIQKYD